MFTGIRERLSFRKLITTVLGLGLLIFCMVCTSSLVLDSTFLVRFLVLVFLTLFLIGISFSFEKTIEFNILDLTLLCFLLYSIVSISWSVNRELAYLEVSKQCLILIFFIVLSRLLFCQALSVKWLLGSVSFTFLISFGFFVFQLCLMPQYSYNEIYKVTGLSGHKNLYSSFVFLSMVCTCLNLNFKSRKLVYVSILILTLQLFVILFLRSRAVWIGTFLFLTTYIVLRFIRINPKKRLVLLFLMFFGFLNVLFFYFLFPEIINIYVNSGIESTSVETLADTSTLTERLLVWEKTYQLIFDNVLIGAGAGNWKIAVMKYGVPNVYRLQSLNVIFQRPHNEFLKIISEYGLFGTILVGISILTFTSKILMTVKKRLNHFHAISLASIIGFSAICFYSFPLERIEHLVLLVIFIVSSKYLCEKEARNQGIVKLKVPIGLFFVVTIACGFIVIQNYKSAYYHKKMLESRSIGNHNEVIKLCDLSSSSFVSLDDLSLPIHWYKGNANASLNNFDLMLEDFQIAQKKSPYNLNVLNDLGSAYLTHNKIDSAIVYYKKALELNPRFDDPKLNLTVIYINLQDWRQANFYNSSLLNDSPRRDVYREIINNALLVNEIEPSQ